MAELPTGTVTLLFTDIEGSTQLLKTLGDDYERALSDHRALLRRAFNLSGGRVVDRQGDAFFVVFSRAKDAVTAAIEAQRSLASHPWPQGSNVRVRMGIHTGEPSVADEGLTGLAVHLGARICSTAHGGEVLVSDLTRGLVEDDLPHGAALRDAGEHLVKDFDRPVHLFQLVAEGLGDPFRQPRTPAQRANDDPLNEENEPSSTGGGDQPRRERVQPEVSPRLRDGLRAAMRRRPAREPIGFLGSRIHSTSRLSPSPELAAALASLGGAVVQGGRCLRDAQRSLRSVDRRALQHRVDELRGATFLTEHEGQLVDDLARQLAAVDRLAELHPLLRAEIERIDSRERTIRDEVFRARLGEPVSDSLVDEVKTLSESMLALCKQAYEAEEVTRPAVLASRPKSRLRVPRKS
jgi:class 3 adenylate cyclase